MSGTTDGPVIGYEEIFDLRGKLYHQAMQAFPRAREEEFLNVIEHASIKPGMTIVDVPSGGAYLAPYLPGSNLISLESSHAFAEPAKNSTESVLTYKDNAFPLGRQSVDRVLSIAGMHHIADKQQFFSEVYRILKPDGLLVAADVAEGSPVRTFLDEFVGKYSDTGHSGWYFGDNTRREINNSHFEIVQDRLLQYHWRAPDKQQLVKFCRTLFGMVHADDDITEEGIGDYLGLKEDANGCRLNWELHCFVCRPRSKQENAP